MSNAVNKTDAKSYRVDVVSNLIYFKQHSFLLLIVNHKSALDIGTNHIQLNFITSQRYYH